MNTRGFFEIGICYPKTTHNIGTLWRSAYQLGASGIFTIGQRCKFQSSDTYKTFRHVPLREFDTFESFEKARPHSSILIAIEQEGDNLNTFKHPERAIYLLGAEDNGLPKQILGRCQTIVSLESVRQNSYNVAVSGSLVMYDRLQKRAYATTSAQSAALEGETPT